MRSALPERPFDTQEFERWRAEAQRALAGAELQAGAELHNWACFAASWGNLPVPPNPLHRSACADERFALGHDLVRLCEEVGAAGVDVPTDVSDSMRRIGRHYIPARYPDAHPSGPAADHYGAADSSEALEDARRVLGFVDATWRGL
jgi:HEPN domain-containing protein